MKKLFSIFSAALIAFTFAACGGNDPESHEAFAETGFENGLFSPWTTIDADGDGANWEIIKEDLPHTGSFCAKSHSDVELIDPEILPDNYLVSPKVKLGGSISFYAAPGGVNFCKEHFGVFVSITSNTAPEAFTMLKEWTMLDGDSKTYFLYQVDLSDYEGKEGYVAIRHFNTYDQHSLHIDDIKIE